MTRWFALLMALGLAASGAAWSQQPKGDDPFAMPIPPEALFKPLPELKGVVSWRTLGQVDLVNQKGKLIPQFSDNVLALDRRDVKLQGFILPLSAGKKQSHFILSSLPPSCPFCLPGNPMGAVEVKARTPVEYSEHPVIVSGRFALIRDDPMGLLYRLVDAVPVK